MKHSRCWAYEEDTTLYDEGRCGHIFVAVRRGTGQRPAQQAVFDALADEARALGLET